MPILVSHAVAAAVTTSVTTAVAAHMPTSGLKVLGRHLEELGQICLDFV